MRYNMNLRIKGDDAFCSDCEDLKARLRMTPEEAVAWQDAETNEWCACCMTYGTMGILRAYIARLLREIEP